MAASVSQVDEEEAQKWLRKCKSWVDALQRPTVRASGGTATDSAGVTLHDPGVLAVARAMEECDVDADELTSFLSRIQGNAQRALDVIPSIGKLLGKLCVCDIVLANRRINEAVIRCMLQFCYTPRTDNAMANDPAPEAFCSRARDWAHKRLRSTLISGDPVAALFDALGTALGEPIDHRTTHALIHAIDRLRGRLRGQSEAFADPAKTTFDVPPTPFTERITKILLLFVPSEPRLIPVFHDALQFGGTPQLVPRGHSDPNAHNGNANIADDSPHPGFITLLDGPLRAAILGTASPAALAGYWNANPDAFEAELARLFSHMVACRPLMLPDTLARLLDSGMNMHADTSCVDAASQSVEPFALPIFGALAVDHELLYLMERDLCGAIAQSAGDCRVLKCNAAFGEALASHFVESSTSIATECENIDSHREPIVSSLCNDIEAALCTSLNGISGGKAVRNSGEALTRVATALQCAISEQTQLHTGNIVDVVCEGIDGECGASDCIVCGVDAATVSASRKRRRVTHPCSRTLGKKEWWRPTTRRYESARDWIRYSLCRYPWVHHAAIRSVCAGMSGAGDWTAAVFILRVWYGYAKEDEESLSKLLAIAVDRKADVTTFEGMHDLHPCMLSSVFFQLASEKDSHPDMTLSSCIACIDTHKKTFVKGAENTDASEPKVINTAKRHCPLSVCEMIHIVDTLESNTPSRIRTSFVRDVVDAIANTLQIHSTTTMSQERTSEGSGQVHGCAIGREGRDDVRERLRRIIAIVEFENNSRAVLEAALCEPESPQ